VIYKIVKTPRFEQEAQTLLGQRYLDVCSALEWSLQRSAGIGQRVRGSDRQVWPIFPGDEFVYVVFYVVSGKEATLLSMIQRPAPMSPQVLNLED
jgi:hypothetical protein